MQYGGVNLYMVPIAQAACETLQYRGLHHLTQRTRQALLGVRIRIGGRVYDLRHCGHNKPFSCFHHCGLADFQAEKDRKSFCRNAVGSRWIPGN